MSISLTPAASNVVRTVAHAMETLILPALTEHNDRSTATTIGHLLRYIAIRIDDEGDVLFEEVPKLHHLLRESAAYLESGAAAGNAAALAQAIHASLAVERDPEIYLSVKRLSAEIAILRQHVCDLLVILNKREDDAADPAGAGLHEKVRAYIAWQIDQETRIIGPSYFGHGARR